MAIRNIVLATDFSPVSRPSEERARELGRALRATVHAIHVVTPFHAEAETDRDLARFTQRVLAAGKEKMTALRRWFLRAGVRAKMCIAVGKPWEAILDHARAVKADLIVLGSHGVTDEGRFYVGTTSHHVFFNAPFPILVVRAPAPPVKNPRQARPG